MASTPVCHAQHDAARLSGQELLQLDDVARMRANAQLVASRAPQHVAQLARDAGELAQRILHAVARIARRTDASSRLPMRLMIGDANCTALKPDRSASRSLPPAPRRAPGTRTRWAA